MDFNIYAAERIAAARLADLRAESARLARLDSARSPRGLTGTLGAALMRLGRRLARTDGVPGGNAGVRVAR